MVDKARYLENSQNFFTVIGDIQRTSLLEKILLRRKDNSRETLKLMSCMADDPGDLVVILGDLVNNGTSTREWQFADKILKKFPRRTHIFPVLGNHDLGFFSRGCRQFSSRFPQFSKSSWYSNQYGSVGLIWLNSNEASLLPHDMKLQRLWFQNTLKTFDESPDVSATAVFLHHPPFTNARWIRPSRFVQRHFLDDFCVAKKTSLIICGHVHRYERFEKKGKIFVVSGGGGGPTTSLRTKKITHESLIEPETSQLFHYMKILLHSHHIEVQVWGLKTFNDPVHLIDTFHIQFGGSHG